MHSHVTFTLEIRARVQTARVCRETKTTPFRVRLVFTDKIVRCSSNWLIVIKSLAVIKINEREQSFGKANVYWTQVTGIYERVESTSSPEVGRCSWQKVASRDSLERACTGRCFRRTMRNKISRLCRTSSRRITVREKASRFCGNLSFFFCFTSLLGNLSNDWQQCWLKLSEIFKSQPVFVWFYRFM